MTPQARAKVREALEYIAEGQWKITWPNGDNEARNSCASHAEQALALLTPDHGEKLNISGEPVKNSPKNEHIATLPAPSEPSAEDVKRFIEIFDTLSRFEAEQRLLRGYGAFDPAELPDGATQRVMKWLHELALPPPPKMEGS